MIRLVGVQASEESGCKYMTGELALENVSADRLSRFTSNNLDQLFDGLVMTTSEGYSYPIMSWNFRGMSDWVPPGFRYKTAAYVSLYTATMKFRAAVGTTGHKVATPCGILDFDNPEVNLRFPTDLPSTSFLSVGTPIKLPEGVLTITSVQTGEDPACSGYTNVTCVHSTFTNASKGYEASLDLYSVVVGSDGILHNSVALVDYFRAYAGPGQTVEGAVGFGTSTQRDRKLIIADNSRYWVVNLD